MSWGADGYDGAGIAPGERQVHVINDWSNTEVT
jgi:hypothetical protein